ncbi:hypothetical protein SteCoe_29081 [Stentor coeruleus]|uniref:Uncharacterized protein n=1 Tax=Stentor coeruleus TaxID=5963 RepID=A0A1R2B750_9CILI|nr:hypothetical protein SteCoe_29081 [Stentor coeruleus]
MKSSISSENDLITRLQTLYENTKITGPSSCRKPKSDFYTSPLSTLKLNRVKTNQPLEGFSDTSFYEKYSRIWQKSTIPQVNINFLSLAIKKIKQRILGNTWRALKTQKEDPLAFTYCIKCGNIGLSLLTTSTQDSLSPRFMGKIKSILPKRPTKVIETSKIRQEPKFQLEMSPKIVRKGYEKSSLDMYSEDLISPEKKNPINDLSEIRPNPYFLSSLSSPEQFHKTLRENRIRKTKEEVSFEISRDSVDYIRENSAYINLPKQMVPKLNFTEIATSSKSRNPEVKEIVNFFIKKSKNHVKWAFGKLKITGENSGVFGKVRANNLPIGKNEKIGNLATVQMKMITNSKRTAFQILYSRLEKFIFRRKMQGFYCISEFLYR